MKKTIIIYYSKTGNNKFLATKIAKELNSDIEEIKPKLNAHLLLMMGLNFGNKKLKHDLLEYERVILCGPVWMGQLIKPLKSFAIKNEQQIKDLVFVSCCGTSFEQKDKKYGHGKVFTEMQRLLNLKCSMCQAIPSSLLLTEEEKEDQQSVMAARLNESNFKGEILDTFNRFIEKLK